MDADLADLTDLRRRLERAERALDNLPQRLAVAPEAARFYLAKIAGESGENSGAAFCDAGVTFRVWPITFVDATFTEAAGIDGLETTDRSADEYFAGGDPSRNYQTGDIVAVYRKNARWWILAAFGNTGSGGSSTVSVEVLTGYQCVSGVAIPCTKTICLPAGTLVSATTCAEGCGQSEGGIETGDCTASENLLLTLYFTSCGCATSVEIALAWNGVEWTGSTLADWCAGAGAITAHLIVDSPGIVHLVWEDSVCAAGVSGGFNLCTDGVVGIDDSSPNTSISTCCSGGVWDRWTIEEA